MAKKQIQSDVACECIECNINDLIDYLCDDLKSFEFYSIKHAILAKITLLTNVDNDRRKRLCDC